MDKHRVKSPCGTGCPFPHCLDDEGQCRYYKIAEPIHVPEKVQKSSFFKNLVKKLGFAVFLLGITVLMLYFLRGII